MGSSCSVWLILTQVVQVTELELFTFFLFFRSLHFFLCVRLSLAVLICSKFVLAVLDYSRLFQLVSSCSGFFVVSHFLLCFLVA